MIAALLLLPPPAVAFECLTWCGGCDEADGDKLTYHIVAGSFGPGLADAIEEGADAWDAGPGKVNRGADWDFVRGADVGSSGTFNFRNDVDMRDEAWFVDHGLPDSAVATAQIRHLGCPRRESDVYFNSNRDWVATPSSLVDTGEVLILMVAAHEFGHVLGLARPPGEFISVMSQVMRPAQDKGPPDISAEARLWEDDFLGLAFLKPGPSDGFNLMAARWEVLSTGIVVPAWARGDILNEQWCGCPGDVLTGTRRPEGIRSLNVGTTTAVGVEVVVTLSTDSTCLDGDDLEVWRRVVTLAPDGTTDLVNVPEWVIPPAAPPGAYWLCARVDPTTTSVKPRRVTTATTRRRRVSPSGTRPASRVRGLARQSNASRLHDL